MISYFKNLYQDDTIVYHFSKKDGETISRLIQKDEKTIKSLLPIEEYTGTFHRFPAQKAPEGITSRIEVMLRNMDKPIILIHLIIKGKNRYDTHIPLYPEYLKDDKLQPMPKRTLVPYNIEFHYEK